MQRDIERRVRALENRLATSEKHLRGYIDVPLGVQPLDALRRANVGPGLWFLAIEDGDTAAVGRVTKDGRCELWGGSSSE